MYIYTVKKQKLKQNKKNSSKGVCDSTERSQIRRIWPKG